MAKRESFLWDLEAISELSLRSPLPSLPYEDKVTIAGNEAADSISYTLQLLGAALHIWRTDITQPNKGHKEETDKPIIKWGIFIACVRVRERKERDINYKVILWTFTEKSNVGLKSGQKYSL